MWSRHSHTLYSRNILPTNRLKFKCEDVEYKVLEYTKSIVDCNTLLAYPDFNKIEIQNDARTFQLG